jgi:DNA-binding beta-propeller fold protein YncE
VQKFTADGKYVLQWQMPQTTLGKPKGMGRDANGNIIVIEPHYQRINIFSTDGKLLDQWGQRGTNAGQLIMPRSVAIDSHGDFFITEYSEVDRVQKFSAKDKSLLNLIGHPGIENGEFNRAEGIDIDSAGRIYVADSCNHRIQIFSPDGKWLRSYGKPGSGVGEMSYPYDVRVDKEGRQYVCEFENSRIQIFDQNGKSLEIIGGPGYEPGQFSNPYAIALDSKGNLYVADSMNHRVQKFIKRTDVADARKLSTDNVALCGSSPSLPTQLEERAGERRRLLLTPMIAFLPSQPDFLPLPKGEGRGEGEGNNRQPIVTDLSHTLEVQRSMFSVGSFFPIPKLLFPPPILAEVTR